MGYTNSPMVVYTKLSPNHSGQRTHGIDRITVHCVVGNCSVETLGEIFAPVARQASSNYGIGVDGRVAMYVEEKNRSWCSSSNANDQRAITIECASDTTHPYAFKDVVYQTLIKLCTDICRRNGKTKLLWLGTKEAALAYEPKSNEMVLTAHRWFAATACPGDWMYAREGDLATKVTAALGSDSSDAVVQLVKGDSGSAVKTMQKMLIACGYSCGDAGADGEFGTYTLKALKKFQKAAGVTVDGIYGPITKAALEKAYKAKKSSDSGSGSAKTGGTQATVLKSLSEKNAIAKVAALFTADQKKTGILASVSLAQFIMESGYGKSELAQSANNLFGLKCSVSGNTWSGSAWDGKSKYTKKTQEQNSDGSTVTITADFRKYSCIEDSISDHSAYLLGAMNGKKFRYDGLKGCMDYKKAAQIIKDGGYATSLTYVEKLCAIIEKWNLTQYDVKASGNKTESGGTASGSKTSDGKTSEVPFLVKVSIPDLNVRKGPGTNYARVGRYTGIGTFTIMEVKTGAGSSSGWGRLKSGLGWIALDYTVRVK